MSNILLKQCTSEHWRALRDAAADMFLSTFADNNDPESMRVYMETAFSDNQVKAELDCADSLFWAAYDGDKIAGYVKVNFRDAQKEMAHENSMEIERIYLDKAYLGSGLAQVLLEKSLALAHEAAVDFVWLGVWEHNPRAIRFYEKNGFTAFSNHTFMLGEEAQTDILMRKIL